MLDGPFELGCDSRHGIFGSTDQEWEIGVEKLEFIIIACVILSVEVARNNTVDGQRGVAL